VNSPVTHSLAATQRHSVCSICSFRMVVSSRLPWEHGILGVTNNDITGGTGAGAAFYP